VLAKALAAEPAWVTSIGFSSVWTSWHYVLDEPL
jgi:hypothetical protein